MSQNEVTKNQIAELNRWFKTKWQRILTIILITTTLKTT